MSHTIFTSNPTALIPQPGRAVNTFPSGLVRVDQTYLGLTAQAATHRATLAVGNDMPDGDSSPCIDGLKIFPEVQERRREDGFTEFIVSAYGRANTEGQKTFSKKLGSFLLGYLKTDTRSAEDLRLFSESVPTINDQMVWKFVLPKFSSPNVTVSDVLKAYRLSGQNASPVTVAEFFDRTGYNTSSPSIVVGPAIDLVVDKKATLAENINFGVWDEWTVVWEAFPLEFLSLGTFYKILPPIAGSIQREISVGPINGGLRDDFSGNLKGGTNASYDSGNAFYVTVQTVENLHTSGISFSSSTPRTNVPPSTEHTSFYGGTVTWQPNGSFTYTAPPVVRPTGRPTSPGQTYNQFGLIWQAVYDGIIPGGSVGEDQTLYRWQFVRSYETFVFTFVNEQNETDTGYMTIEFDDPVYPAAEN